MADVLIVVVDGYNIALQVGSENDLTEAQARVMMSLTRAERRNLERELEREVERVASRAGRRLKARIYTSLYGRDSDGQLVERKEMGPNWVDIDLIKTEVRERLRELFETWINMNPWVRNIRPEVHRWLR